MCGISGALDPDEARCRLRVTAINRLQQHRGPDDAVVRRAGSFTVGNTRLAIQEPSPAGNQPFVSREGRFVCVFNGEIYNFPELIIRHRLTVDSHCDGAVIPELWARLGRSCLPLLRGMWAIAMVDTHADTLTLARDPFGIKPLHWRWLGDGSLLFASEPRSLAGFPPSPSVSPKAVARFLHLGSLAPAMSPFEGVQTLAPNSGVMFDQVGRSETFPVLDDTSRLLGSGSPPDAPCLGQAVRESVEMHLRSDVPSALLLSGGVDSAAVASAARTEGRELFCVTVAGIGREDESEAAASTARHYGHQHTVIPAELDEDAVRHFFTAMQRPTIDGLNTFLVCRAIKECGLKVALTGIGGDEALGGYSHFRLLRLLPLLRALDAAPAPAARVAKGVARRLARFGSRKADSSKVHRLLSQDGPRDAWSLDLLQREVLSPQLVQELTGIDPPTISFERADLRDATSLQALVEAEIELYLQSTLLPDADAFSMQSSVELRVPFVDKEVFTAASARLVGGGGAKRDLAAALGDQYLESLTRRPKQGFSVPMRKWMSDGPLQPLVAGLGSRHAPIWEQVDERAGREILDNSRGSARWSTEWSLAALNTWLEDVLSVPRL